MKRSLQVTQADNLAILLEFYPAAEVTSLIGDGDGWRVEFETPDDAPAEVEEDEEVKALAVIAAAADTVAQQFDQNTATIPADLKSLIEVLAELNNSVERGVEKLSTLCDKADAIREELGAIAANS